VALEADRIVRPMGNLWIGGQQIWLGPVLAGCMVTFWVDETTLDVLLDGTRLKTLPSRLGITELARLGADGARSAGPLPQPGGEGLAIEVERMVNGIGLVALAGEQLGRLRTRRPARHPSDGRHADGGHQPRRRTAAHPALPVTPADRHRLRGARRAASTPPPPGVPLVVQRRVSQRGSIMVAAQRIHVGMIHAGKTVSVTAADHSFQLDIEGDLVGIVARTTTSAIHRYKAYATRARKPVGWER